MRNQKESSSNANAAVVQKGSVARVDSSNEGEDYDVLTVSTSNFLNTQVIDTSALHHMTFNGKLFISFKEQNDNVKLGDDGELRVKGSGSMHIQIYDDIVKIFDAWYVPDERI